MSVRGPVARIMSSREYAALVKAADPDMGAEARDLLTRAEGMRAVYVDADMHAQIERLRTEASPVDVPQGDVNRGEDTAEALAIVSSLMSGPDAPQLISILRAIAQR